MKLTALWAAMRRWVIGRRFAADLEQNRRAADKLDAAVRELIRK